MWPDRAGRRLLGINQICEARSCFNQTRMIIHVTPARQSGTNPTSRFLPNHGNASIRRRASQLNVPLAKIHPPWSPIGTHNERVRTRASARIQPTRNNVTNADPTITGSPNPANAWAIDWKPELHVTISVGRFGPFKKCTAANRAETATMGTHFRPVLSKIPKMSPRKNVSSMSGTLTVEISSLPNRDHRKTCRNE